ncbi:MAG TPA: tetratricopeptide repeat protein [Chthoniobacterales bacterium]|jgi:tetratricopeptide (TPR) repeat protein|nr:tetratricopeptide repeat protein [Chthoniobacterales bacterium]
MNAVSLSRLSRTEKTFSVSVALLGAVAAAQILAALYLYTRQMETGPISPKRKAVEERLFQAPKVAPRPSAGPIKVPAVAGVPPATVERVETPPKSVPETLLRVAKGFRERGDTANAIAKLRQATALDPGNAEILAELALTYESMQLFDRSNEVWRRLQSLGPAAGPLYELADVKLRVGAPANAGAPAASGAPGASAESADIPEGSAFGISQVSLKRLEDPEAQTKLLLRVGVKVRPGIEIDHTKVKIQVFFYDMVNNSQVVLTDADVSYEWVTPGHNWADTGNEVLDVTYLRPKSPPPGSVPAAEVPDSVEKAKLSDRKPEEAAEMLPTSESGPHEYLGYIVRVYYKDQLQAVRADPTRLLNLFPPPFTAAPQ